MKPTYRPMTELEGARAMALSRCTLPPASMTKHFAHNLAAQVARGDITEKQAAFLAVSCYRYRRQIIADGCASLVPEVPPPGYSTPTMVKQAAELQRYRERVKK